MSCDNEKSVAESEKSVAESEKSVAEQNCKPPSNGTLRGQEKSFERI